MTPDELVEIEGRLRADAGPWRLLEDARTLLAEVRRLTPAARVATWGDGGALNDQHTVLRANNNRTIAKYGYDESRGHDPWVVWIGTDYARFHAEPEARAHIETWAKSKGYQVRDGK